MSNLFENHQKEGAVESTHPHPWPEDTEVLVLREVILSKESGWLGAKYQVSKF
jgi:hypothetical protein